MRKVFIGDKPTMKRLKEPVIAGELVTREELDLVEVWLRNG